MNTQTPVNKHCMSDMAWQDKLQFCCMALMGASMPVSWRLGLLAALLLAAASLVKLFADVHDGKRPLHNPALNGWMRGALWAAVAYVAVYAVSLLYSNNVDAGLTVLAHKAVILIFPLCFLLTDTSYLKPSHARTLFYALLIAVCTVFLCDVAVAAHKLAGGSSLKSVTGPQFDNRHHAYVALYALTALVFAHFELAGHWRSLRHWHRGLLLFAAACCILYIELVNSRAGMLGLYAMALLCPAHFALTTRRWWQSLLAAALLLGIVASAEQLLPGHQNRLKATLEAGESDARIGILKSSLNAMKQSPVTGQGAGDYEEALTAQYEKDEQTFAGKEFNAHNQYIETLLAVGIAGLLILTAWLLLPLLCAIGRKKAFWPVAFFSGIVMFNLLFESMLERQMGLLFIGFFSSLMVLITSMDKNKFVRMAKK